MVIGSQLNFSNMVIVNLIIFKLGTSQFFVTVCKSAELQTVLLDF